MFGWNLKPQEQHMFTTDGLIDRAPMMGEVLAAHLIRRT